MDHLPRPSARNDRGKDSQRECTLLLGNLHDDYPKVPFHEYPRSRGLVDNVTEVFRRGRQISMEDARQAVTVIQNWLFFGLLEEVLRKQIRTEDCTVVEGQNTYLSTRYLEDWITQWEKEVKACEYMAKLDWQSNTSMALMDASVFFRIISPRFEDTTWKSFHKCLIPLAVLADTIHSRYFKVFGTSAMAADIVLADSSYAETLAQRGWCRNLMSTTLLAFSSPSIREYIKSFRDRPNFLTRNHNNCTEQACIASNVDLDAYEVNHVCENSNCGYVKPDMKVIQQALDSGTVPVVLFSKAKNQLFTLMRGPRTAYFAISHVWADGLGSSSETGLPICRIIDLANTVTEVCGREDGDYFKGSDLSPAFWIDSLCIPSEVALRKLSINRMADVYGKASAVIVLDKGIQQVITNDPLQEQLLAISSSGWSHRLWTLQEALLARKILLRTCDGAVDFEQLTTTAALQGTMNKLFWMLSSGEFFIAKQEAKPTLGLVSRQLSTRASSKPSDEILALLGTFGLDATGYHDLNAEDRMIKFLREHNSGKIHKNIVFFEGEKLKHHPFTWAPRTFMSRHREGILPPYGGPEDHMVSINDDGLGGQWECFVPESPWSSEHAPLRFVLRLRELPDGMLFESIGGQVPLEDRTGEQVYLLRVAEDPPRPEEGHPVMAVRIVERVYFPDGLSFMIAEAKYQLTAFSDRPEFMQTYSKNNPTMNATLQNLWLLFR
ncbi:hypothetical protein V1517DRAFT_205424 [Lipomyces orientalis]|uniref:Uncharacterized protein n=1 Tax=Lipomyces orientalis TaxID=1233043 RepID=A0ACC3THZ5_9ASCO